jgi:cysteine-rich repeat protein
LKTTQQKTRRNFIGFLFFVGCSLLFRPDKESFLETCQDGLDNDNDGAIDCDDSRCKPFCASSCGDGAVDEIEQCDDGNKIEGDGCSSLCLMEICGDGFISNDEGCDDGNLTPGDGCNDVCNVEFCGDGILNNGSTEECDGTPNCTSDCRLPTSGSCGDGIVNFTEECDDANAKNDDFCLTSCLLAKCGDSFVLIGIEECDDGNSNLGDGCDHLCHVETCGNGAVDNNEECDDGDLNNNNDCLSDCTNAKCGDGFLRTNLEQCDDHNNVSGDGCSDGCFFEICGDGVVNNSGTEECDGDNLNGATCSSFGSFGDGLACDANCSFNLDACGS